MQTIAWISFFGLVGLLSRYGIDQIFTKSNEQFPVSTMFINLCGSFLAGLIYAWSLQREISPQLQTGLLVGLCGGFTTFSAYALQTMILAERGKWFPAVAYFTLSPVLGLLAAFIPILVMRKI